MILKKFLGKTIETAKKSARQMYGDNIVVLETVPPEGKNKAGITVMIDEETNRQSRSNNETDAPRHGRDGADGVRFERSGDTADGSNPAPPSTLGSLRKFARQQEKNRNTPHQNSNTQQGPSDRNRRNGAKPKTEFTPRTSFPANGTKNNIYSRSSIRRGTGASATDQTEFIPSKNRSDQDDSGKSDASDSPDRSLLSKFDRSQPKIGNSAASSAHIQSRREQREISALHKRFDKLESLLDSALISSNLEYASHPAFQQLVQTGIGTSTIAGWFGDIIKEGIDPYDQTEMFMSRLSAIIRDALSSTPPGPPAKYLLFTGPSGAGKTRLIMKLSLHPAFLEEKNIAVVSILPPGEKGTCYYTVLSPFCVDNDIPHDCVKTGADISRLQKKWDEYDHVLIDTPPVSTGNDNAFREYWKLRQLLAPLTPLEVHYVVNASMNRFYFRHSSAVHHPLQPDFVAITHLDEVSQWGPVIPFLKEMGCSARYVSMGTSIPHSLDTFNPARFAQKVLQNT